MLSNVIACFPNVLSYKLYFQMQRRFGSLRKPHNPISKFSEAVNNILKNILQHRKNIIGKTFFEVGTGWVPIFPVAYWLGGAEKTISVDLNHYMRRELIMDMLYFIKANETEIRDIFGELLINERFNVLLNYASKNKIHINDFLELCQIEYIAPGNAANTNLAKNSIHYHISNAVYEHIPLPIIHDILEEGNRIIADDGLFINVIDYRDHFWYMDKNISAINFLQYSDSEWDKYAGNRYMYMNRVRHDDFIELFKTVGHEFLGIDPSIDKKIEIMLENNELGLDNKFKNKSKEILSTLGAIFITIKNS